MTRSSIVRATWLAMTLASASGVLLSAPAASAQTQRDAAAEAYIQTEASRGLAILKAGRETAEFPAFIDQAADVPRISRFVLGKYARSVDPAKYQSFAAAFRVYADGVFESRFAEYRNGVLKVTGSTVRKPGDVVVASEVTGAGAPEPVAWRVISAGGGWKIVDVQVAGVWLAITEQQDFVSTLDNNRGDLGVLTRQLQSQNSAGRSRS